MLDKLRRGYRKVRYLPRHVITTLDRIASGVASLREQREASFLQSASALRDVHAEITLFCDEATRVMLGLLASTNAATTQISNIERRLGDAEASLLGLKAALDTNRAEAAQRHDHADAKLRDVTSGLVTLSSMVPTMQALTDTAVRQSNRIAHLGAVLAETARIYPSWLWTPEVAARVRGIMSLLGPVAVPGVNKTRLGRNQDGGYVMLDDFAGIPAALSLGIADDVSWDSDIANLGIRVHQFDPTVTASPASNQLFHFEPLRVAPCDGDGAVSLDTIVRTRIEPGDAPLILKIDIEGEEWPVFLATAEPAMRRFKQIVCEFHNLERLGEAEFGDRAQRVFSKLAQTHFVYHVHGNNCANFTNVGNVVVPQSLEVSFGLRSAYDTAPCVETFPTPLDHPNEPGRADLYLGNFHFGET